jgi:hypothetical protein
MPPNAELRGTRSTAEQPVRSPQPTDRLISLSGGPSLRKCPRGNPYLLDGSTSVQLDAMSNLFRQTSSSENSPASGSLVGQR